MENRVFNCTRKGRTHEKNAVPCQDASVSREYRGSFLAAVADGHGNRRHYRSGTGARLACETVLEQFQHRVDLGVDWLDEESLMVLKRKILTEWKKKVQEDLSRNPWTEEEIRIREETEPEGTGETDPAVAYGSTLCAVFANLTGWAAIQIGDGCFVHISPEGEYTWKMPPSQVNEGNVTASLCMKDPLSEFRHCRGEDRPAGLLVCTDGVDKVFAPFSPRFASFLHWIWDNARKAADGYEGNLENALDTLTARSAAGDDASVAGIVDIRAVDAEPVITKQQARQERERLLALIREAESSLEYIRERLREETEKAPELSDAAGQLMAIKEKRELQLGQLIARLKELNGGSK